MTRPFRAWGYPVTTVLVLLCSLIFLIAAVHDDLVSALRAAMLLAVAAPAYAWMRWKLREPGQS
jgi:APA family basic amino acid/polyamine antiporter